MRGGIDLQFLCSGGITVAVTSTQRGSMLTLHQTPNACMLLLNGCVLQAAGQQGDTAPPPPEQDVDLHFIAFVEHAGGLEA